jgi:hypothetical protein
MLLLYVILLSGHYVTGAPTGIAFNAMYANHANMAVDSNDAVYASFLWALNHSVVGVWSGH